MMTLLEDCPSDDSFRECCYFGRVGSVVCVPSLDWRFSAPRDRTGVPSRVPLDWAEDCSKEKRGRHSVATTRFASVMLLLARILGDCDLELRALPETFVSSSLARRSRLRPATCRANQSAVRHDIPLNTVAAAAAAHVAVVDSPEDGGDFGWWMSWMTRREQR